MNKLFSSRKTETEAFYTILGMTFTRKRKKGIRHYAGQIQQDLQKLRGGVDSLMRVTDPKTMPKASGYTRIVQMLCLQGLCEIDRICRKHNLSYWLAFGTLLGAVRHGGFIPWDDDLDLCMMADDYKKFLEVVDEELAGSDYSFHVYPGQIGKLLHKDFMPESEEEWVDFIRWRMKGKLCFAVDIFPCYRAAEGYTIESLKEALLECCEEKRALADRYTPEGSLQADALVKAQNARLSGNGPLCFCGMELLLTNTNMQRLDDIFPLRELMFEGKPFYAPNKTYKVLTRIFGDFMQVRIDRSHLGLSRLPLSEKEKLLGYVDLVTEAESTLN